MSVMERLLIARHRECDERRRYIADLEGLVERFRGDARRLLGVLGRTGYSASIAAEDGNATEPSTLAERYRKLEGSIAEIEDQIAVARGTLAAAEQELKRHATARTRRIGLGGLDYRGRPIGKNGRF